VPNLNIDLSRASKLDPSGWLESVLKQLHDAHNNIGKQVNAAPVGKTPAPQPISGVTVTGAGGVHEVAIQDNTPANRGLHYFVEWDTSKDFTNPRQESLGPDRQWRANLGVPGPIFVRAYSGYPTSEPSEPVYHGSSAGPIGVDAGGLTLTVSGGTATGTITGPSPLANVGVGTEPSLLPQPSAGFGFDDTRSTVAPGGRTLLE
jgi:hypothetical protein